MAKSSRKPEERLLNAIFGKPFERKVPDFIDFVRDDFGFRDYFDADCDDLCHMDESGVEVYEEDKVGAWHSIGQVPNVSVSSIEDMSEEEFDEFLIENGIL